MGPHVPWTSGVISEVDPTEEDPKQACTMHHALPSCLGSSDGLHVWWLWDASVTGLRLLCGRRQVGGAEHRYHIVITAQGTAVHWQSRVHYYWYRKVRCLQRCPAGRMRGEWVSCIREV